MMQERSSEYERHYRVKRCYWMPIVDDVDNG